MSAGGTATGRLGGIARGPIRAAFLAAVLGAALGAPAARAQTVTDGSDAALGPETSAAVLALVARVLRSPDARVTDLRPGRAGALCGAVDLRNRMGTYTGPRPFVADPGSDFLGRLPEGPELRNPGSPAAYQALQRARSLFAANCMQD